MDGKVMERPLKNNAKSQRSITTILLAVILLIVLLDAVMLSFLFRNNQNSDISYEPPVQGQEVYTMAKSVSFGIKADNLSLIRFTEPETSPLSLSLESDVAAEVEYVMDPAAVYLYDTPSVVVHKKLLKEFASPVVLRASENSRYYGIQLTEDDVHLLASIIWLEARGESITGQTAVAEVVFNRMMYHEFPDTLREVIFEKNQFPTVDLLEIANPGPKQYSAIIDALEGSYILPFEVIFFAQEPENENIWGKIGGHVFCYPWTW